MFFHAISAYSNESAAAAVSQAVGIASSDYSHDAKSVHVIVDAVFQVGEGWKAIVRVIIQEDLEPKEDEKEKQWEEKSHQEIKKQILEEEDEEDEMVNEFRREIMEELHEEAVIYLHFPTAYHEIYEEFSVTEPDYHLHILEEGPLWEIFAEHPLDIEFYEATHTEGHEARLSEDARKFQEKMKAPRLQKKIHGALQDLEPD